MSTENTISDCKSDAFECLGPIALKAVALVAVLAVFVPLLAAFAAPFLG